MDAMSMNTMPRDAIPTNDMLMKQMIILQNDIKSLISLVTHLNGEVEEIKKKLPSNDVTDTDEKVAWGDGCTGWERY